MEAIIVLLLLGILIALLILPIVALVFAIQASHGANQLRAEVAELREELRQSRVEPGRRVPVVVHGIPEPIPSPPEVVPPVGPSLTLPEPVRASREVTGPPAVVTAAAGAGADSIPAELPAAPVVARSAEQSVLSDQPLAGTPVPVPEPASSEAPAPSSPAELEPPATASGSAQPIPSIVPPVTRPAPPAHIPPAPPRTVEERIGLTWLMRIGALLLIVGLGFFFKEAVERGWLVPWARVALGGLAGVGFLVAGEVLGRGRRPVHPLFRQGMLALGLSFLLVSAYASYAFYQLTEYGEAFTVFALLAAGGGALAYIHRAEAILVLSLIAALSNPILLSRGVDNPGALFAYLLLVTSGALAVAVRLRFFVALCTALVGTVIIALGWYLKYFELPTLPLQPLQGSAYLPLSARAIPLVFAVLFPGQWLLVGWLLRRAGRSGWATALELVAFGSIHLACWALLWDHPLIVVSTVTVLAAVAAGWVLLVGRQPETSGESAAMGELPGPPTRRPGTRRWLLLVLLLEALSVLAAQTPEVVPEQRLPLLLLAGVWAAIYLAAQLPWLGRSGAPTRSVPAAGARAGRLHEATPLDLLYLYLPPVGFGLLALLWLLPDEHRWALGLLLPVTLGLLLLGGATRHPGLDLITLLLSLLGVSIAAIPADGTDPVALALVSGWGLSLLVACALDLLPRGRPWHGLRLLVLATAGLGYLLPLLQTTASTAQGLRGTAVLVVAALYLLLGLAMRACCSSVKPAAPADLGPAGSTLLSAPPTAPARPLSAALLPFGLATGFTALAVGLLFSGFTITVLWAIQAAVLAYLAGAGRSRVWLTATFLLFGLALIRLVGQDLDWLLDQQAEFWSSHGQEGVLAATAFLNPRAWALAGIGLALLVSVRLLRPAQEQGAFKASGWILLIIGHLLLLLLCVGEAQLLFTHFPVPPAPGAGHEVWDTARQAAYELLESQENRLSMVATVVMGGYAAALLLLGFTFRSLAHRLFGLALFGFTLGKLCFWDIWSLERVYQIVILVSLGLLLLGGSFLYARFGSRLIRGVLEDGQR